MDWNKIIMDFKSGYSVLKISKKYDIPYKKVDNYLINNGYKVVKHTKLSKKQINQCVDMIKSGNSITDISDELKMDIDTIRNIANEYNLIISVKKVSRDIKNIDFNDNYFENIDTEEKAYFLGLIYSDGNVRERNGKYYLNIELKREDKYILEKFASELRCGNKIYDRDRITNFGESHMSSFTTCNSKKLFDDLSKFNIIPDKSHTTKSFANIEELMPKQLIKHFLRGLVDGDGTISRRYTTNQNSISVYQNEIEFCYDFDRLLKESMNNDSLFQNIILNKNNGVYNLRYRRLNDVIKICNHLYGDASIYLKRKYELAKLYFYSCENSQTNDSLLLCSNE